MPLSAEEFLCRFVQHVPPRGFPRIRYFGRMANRERAAQTSPFLATPGIAELQQAESGDATTQLHIAIEYATGVGVAKDDTEATRWFRKAAVQGNAQAQHNLGAAYFSGIGIAKDEAEGVRWFRKAAEQGYAMSQYNLGMMYDNGRIVPKNGAEAVRWYRKAAEQGHAKAQYNLGGMYHDGRGVPKNEAEAYFWLSLSVPFFDNESDSSLLAKVGGCLTESKRVEIQERCRKWAATHPPESQSGAATVVPEQVAPESVRSSPAPSTDFPRFTLTRGQLDGKDQHPGRSSVSSEGMTSATRCPRIPRMVLARVQPKFIRHLVNLLEQKAAAIVNHEQVWPSIAALAEESVRFDLVKVTAWHSLETTTELATSLYSARGADLESMIKRTIDPVLLAESETTLPAPCE